MKKIHILGTEPFDKLSTWSLPKQPVPPPNLTIMNAPCVLMSVTRLRAFLRGRIR
jgi:hypothetical protein